MKNLLRKLKGLPKSLKVLALTTLAVAMPVIGVVQANTDLMEGHVKSLNVTAGETEYKDTTSAKVDEVVQVQLWHHNRENPAGEKVENTTVKFDVPTEQGKTQVVTGTSSSDNGNTIEDTTTINLSLERARLDYIEGSAKFRYNKGAADGDETCQTGFDFPPERCYATVSIPDAVIDGGVNLDEYRGGPLTGCNAFHETVIIQVRVIADVVSVNKFVRPEGGDTDDWQTSITAQPGEKLEYMIRFKNEGNTTLEDVMVGDNLPKYHTYIEDTTMLANSNHPSGVEVNNDNITRGGINVGNYQPGAVGLVWFTIELDAINAYEKCGEYDLRNVGIVQPKGMIEYYNTAQVIIDVECDEDEPEEPVYACETLTAKKLGPKKYEFTATATAKNGATIKQYRYTFGDNTEELLTDKATVEHTFAQSGTYVIRVSVDFTVDGETVTKTSKACEVVINTEKEIEYCPIPGKEHLPKDSPECVTVTTPPELPKTGPADMIGIFAAVSIAAGIAHKIVLSRRFF